MACTPNFGMTTGQQYRLTQDTAAVRSAADGRYSITKLVMGTIVAVHGTPDGGVPPDMVEIESDGGNYVLFACDFAERAEPVESDYA